MRKTNTQEGRRLKGRDFITTGIFLALYFILMMIPMIISGIHPILWVLFPDLRESSAPCHSCCCALACKSPSACSSWAS